MGVLVSRHYELLGTVIEMRIETETASAATHIETEAIDEIERLQARPQRLCAGIAGERLEQGECPRRGIDEVPGLAERWHRLSDGAFEPYVGRLRELSAAAAARRNRDRGSVDLNGIAKGCRVEEGVGAVADECIGSGLTEI
jgi:thiamine biosynthesis lipoprotein ApbE